MPQTLERQEYEQKRSAPAQRSNAPGIGHHWPFILVCSFFILTGGLISLGGEFPVNDDWIYTKSVKHLVETGEFKMTGTVASSIFPVYVGGAVCKVFGFSFETLRAINFFWGLCGATGLYLCLRELRLKPRDAAMGSSIYLFNPLVVNLCFGFMTDVPALAMNNWLLYFGIRLARALNRGAIFSGVVALSLAVASRQTALAFLPAFGVFVFGGNTSVSKRIAIASGMVAWPILFYKLMEPVFLGACSYLESYEGYKMFFVERCMSLIKTPLTGFAIVGEQAMLVMMYLGLFCMPALAALLPAALSSKKKLVQLALPAIAISALCFVAPFYDVVFAKKLTMPLSENLFSPPAVGTYCILSGGVPGWGSASRFSFTWFTGAVGVIMLGIVLMTAALPFRRKLGNIGAAAARRIREPRLVPSKQWLFILVAAGATLSFLSLQTSVMNLDRYYLLGLGPLIVLTGYLWRRLRAGRFWLSTFVVCVGLAAYSFTAALDNMSFQRARWQALNWLVSQGVSPLEIDGGPEFNYQHNISLAGGYRMDKEMQGWPDEMRGAAPRNQWRWWPITSEKFIVAGSPMDGYQVVRKFPYFSALKFRNREIFVLSRLTHNRSIVR